MVRKHSKNSPATLFTMNTLDDLGIQRLIIWIVNNWDPKQYGSVALSLHTKVGRLKNFLSEEVQVFEIDNTVKPIKHLAFFCRVFSYYFLLKKIKPKKVIAVNQGEGLALCLVKRFYKDFRLIISEHCHVSSNISGADAHKEWFGWYYRHFFRHEYRKYADIVHTVSYEGAEDLIQNHNIPAEKVVVIYNPVELDRIKQLVKENVDEPWLKPGNNAVITASRLSHQKRLDILLKAWKLVKQKEKQLKGASPLKLLICGDGPLREKLVDLVEELNITDSVKFLGFQENPWKFIKRARLFVNSSEWEGLACSLIEAQALGIPIVASDCPSGNKEIVMDGEAGFLFESKNIEDCADKIMKAITNRDLCISKVKKGTAYVHRFDLNEIIKAYSDL